MTTALVAWLPADLLQLSTRLSMRTQFIGACPIEQAEATAPWAAIITAVDGGWMAFESSDDYATWEAQA